MVSEPSPALLVWHTYIWPALAFLIFLVALPVVAPVLLIFRAYRNWLVNRIRHRCPEVEVMKQTDAIWLQNTDENLGIINSLWWLRGKPDIAKWRQHIITRMTEAKNLNGELLYPKLTMIAKTVWHRYIWEQCDNFDMTKNVFMYDRDAPQDEKEMEILLGKLCSRPIQQDIPQWQVIIIPLVSKDHGQYVCMMRVHHAIGDGVSLVRMFMSKFVDVAEPIKKPESVQKDNERFGTKNQIIKMVQAVLTAPVISINRMLTGYDRNALHGPKLSGDKLVAWSNTIDLDFIKKMKNAGHCTVNDILMSCLASTFQAYFKRYCSVTPAEIGSSVPVDIRRSKPEDTTLDNQFSIVYLGLPLREKGPRETLKETKRRMDAVKRSAEPIINSWTMTYLMARLPSWLSHFMFDQVTNQCSMVVSNVPGPQTPLSVNGDVIQRAVFWPPQRSEVGMAISLLSYNGNVTLGLIVDKMILSNPRVLVQLFEDSVSDLAKDLGVPETLTMEDIPSSDC